MASFYGLLQLFLGYRATTSCPMYYMVYDNLFKIIWMLVLPTVNICSDQLLAVIEGINASSRLTWIQNREMIGKSKLLSKFKNFC